MTTAASPVIASATTNPEIPTEMPLEERSFVELRRKVRSAEILSAAVERLLRTLRFTGRLTVVVQNGKVLKSGYEEGYFSQRERESPARL